MGQRIRSYTNDKAAWWTDDTGVTHICESTAPLSNELLIWTLCDREVESGAAFAPSSRRDIVSCSKCAAAESVLRRRHAQPDKAGARSSRAEASDGHLPAEPMAAS